MQYWTNITIKSIEKYLNPAQFAQIQKGLDNMEWVIEDIVAKVRAEVASFSGNQVLPNRNAVPESLVYATAYLIIESLQCRIPTLKLTVDQVRLIESARNDLKRVANGELKLEQTASSAQYRSQMVVKSRSETISSEHLWGL